VFGGSGRNSFLQGTSIKINKLKKREVARGMIGKHFPCVKGCRKDKRSTGIGKQNQ